MRWIVGDLHGCVRQLEALLREIEFDAGEDELWSIGDLVNKGPDSAATVRLWLALGGRGVIGNHDIHAIRAHEGRAPSNPSLRGLMEAPDCDTLLDSLRRLPALAFVRGPSAHLDVWLVHGGVHPSWVDLHRIFAELDGGVHDEAWFQREEVQFATQARCCTPRGIRSDYTGPPHGCPAPYRGWDAYYRGNTLVLHGHWARRGVHRTGRVIGLDSGCVYGGKLTAWCQDEDRIVQVSGWTGTAG